MFASCFLCHPPAVFTCSHPCFLAASARCANYALVTPEHIAHRWADHPRMLLSGAEGVSFRGKQCHESSHARDVHEMYERSGSDPTSRSNSRTHSGKNGTRSGKGTIPFALEARASLTMSRAQEPAVVELLSHAHEDLVGKAIPGKMGGTAASHREVLAQAAAGQQWLLVLDDLWSSEHERMFNFIDPVSSPEARVFATSRFAKLLVRL